MEEKKLDVKPKGPVLNYEDDAGLPPGRRPESHNPPRPKTMKEQEDEHKDKANQPAKSAWQTGETWNPWLTTAVKIGSKNTLLQGIFEAVWESYRTGGDQVGGAVDHAWLKDKLDEYGLATLDADARHYVAEQFDVKGVNIRGAE